MEEKIQNSALQLGYIALKPKQLEVVTQFVKGKDVFVVLLTGYRKTLCLVFFLLCFHLAPVVSGVYGNVLDLPFDPFSSLSTFSNLSSNFTFLVS